MITNPDEFICVGVLGKTYGNKGKLNVVSMTSFPERFSEMKTLFLTKDSAIPKNVDVENFEFVSGKICVKISGIDTMSEAEKLTGYRIMIHNSEKFELPEDYTYIDDLIGCQVEDNGNNIGEIIDVEDMGTNDIYVVSLNGEIYRIPVISEFVKEIIPEKKLVKVELIPGMLPDES
ncbi:MAG: 16S rRNA processing protein RimM [Candidatus Delongbacteria bacterium]|nr:16S rRNA processing protein RimM [Candidatus Delongbacteria bacterium]MBN2833574.1 16S rRNA processing protein RimM [Candidatus Delongbacteria bacterium]